MTAATADAARAAAKRDLAAADRAAAHRDFYAANAARDAQAALARRQSAMSDVVWDLHKSRLSRAWQPPEERRDTADDTSEAQHRSAYL